MTSIFLILPIHLFEYEILQTTIKSIEPAINCIMILEEPVYFGHHYIEMNFNKLKLIRRVTENFTCIGENNEIVEFTNEIEIIEAFITDFLTKHITNHLLKFPPRRL